MKSFTFTWFLVTGGFHAATFDFDEDNIKGVYKKGKNIILKRNGLSARDYRGFGITLNKEV